VERACNLGLSETLHHWIWFHLACNKFVIIIMFVLLWRTLRICIWNLAL
jgi:hypothetical protein